MSIVEACPAALHTIRVAAPRLLSDQDLVARMADGDQSALRELMRRSRGRLQRFVARKVNDRDQIDDVVNDTFMAACDREEPGLVDASGASTARGGSRG